MLGFYFIIDKIIRTMFIANTLSVMVLNQSQFSALSSS